MNRVGIMLSRPRSPDIVIVDYRNYYTMSRGLVEGIPQFWWSQLKPDLLLFPGECVLVFDRNDNASPNDHERMRRAGVVSKNYNIPINSPPNRDTFLKNPHKTLQLSRVFNTFDMSAAVTIDTQDTGVFTYEEVGVTIISYVLHAVGEGKNVVRVLCDDKDVFTLLVF